MKKIFYVILLLGLATIAQADTQTTNVSMTKPTPGGSVNTWGPKLNTNFDIIDSSAAWKWLPNTFASTQTFTLAPQVSAFSAGGVVFSGNSGFLSQDPSRFFYDFTTGFLSLGTLVQSSTLTVAGFIESTAGGFVFPDGSEQTSAFGIGQSAVGGIQNSVMFLNASTQAATSAQLAFSTSTNRLSVGGWISVSDFSNAAILTGTNSEPFAGLVGEDFCLDYNGTHSGCRTFVNLVEFTIDSVDNGTDITVSGDTDELHPGSWVRQGTHTVIVASINLPTVSLVDSTGFTAATATHSDFLNPSAATADEVQNCLLNYVAWPQTVSFNGSSGELVIDSDVNGSLYINTGDAAAILGFSVGQYAPQVSVQNKSWPLTGFLFDTQSGNIWGFADSTRLMHMNGGEGTTFFLDTQFDGDINVQQDANITGNLAIGGQVAGLEVGGALVNSNGNINVRDETGDMQIALTSQGASDGGHIEVYDSGDVVTINLDSEARVLTVGDSDDKVEILSDDSNGGTITGYLDGFTTWTWDKFGLTITDGASFPNQIMPVDGGLAVKKRVTAGENGTPVNSTTPNMHVVGANGDVASFPSGAENATLVVEDDGAASIGIIGSSTVASELNFFESGSNSAQGGLSYNFSGQEMYLTVEETLVATVRASSTTFTGMVASDAGGFKLPDGTVIDDAGDLGGGLSIGGAVSGGGANRILFEDASQNLTTNAGFTFSTSTLAMTSPIINISSTGNVNNMALQISTQPRTGWFMDYDIADLGAGLHGFTQQVNGSTVAIISPPGTGTGLYYQLQQMDFGGAGGALGAGVGLDLRAGDSSNPSLSLGGGSTFSIFNGGGNDAFTIKAGSHEYDFMNTGNMRVPEGGPSNPAYGFTTHTDAGIFLDDADDTTNGILRFTLGAADRLVAVSTAGIHGPTLSVQTLGSGGIVTPNACGGIKPIESAGAITTDTTTTIAALGAGSAQRTCNMDICNLGSNNITLDNNANFIAGGDIVMTPNDCIRVATFNGTNWLAITALKAN